MKTKITASVLAVALLLGLLVWLWGAQAGHFLWSMLRPGLPALLVGIILATIAGVIATSLTRGLHSDDRFIVTAGSMGIALLVGLIPTLTIVNGYVVPKSYNEIMEEAPAGDLDFRQRVPYDVATAMSARNLGDTTGDTTGSIKALPAEGDHGQYTTSVIRRGFAQGYESTQTLSPKLIGSAGAQDVQFCDFGDSATLRLGGGMPRNNLGRAIMWRTSPSTLIDTDDALVRCEDGTPMVYVPLTKLDGSIFLPKRIPGGVAVYNGETGDLQIHKELETDLPLYPQSVARNQREALTRTGSFTDWIFGRSGYEDTSKDGEDPNGDNRAEFALASRDGKQQVHVTPLTSRGSSSSIVALGTTRADGKIISGQLNPYVVHKYADGEPRQATSAIAARITGEVLSGYMASGLTVFEVVPAEEGTWAATIGKDQAVLYRATIHPDGRIDLVDAKGKDISGTSTSEGSESAPRADKPLEDMTAAELKSLADDILEELAGRAGQ